MNIVFDIGGTKMRVAATKDGRRFEGEPYLAETPKDFAKGVEKFSLLARQAAGGRAIQSVIGGIAGVLDRHHVSLIRSGNLAGWEREPLKRELERALGAPVKLFNDTALVGLGEATRGAGRDFKIVAYVTVSTGVGGARIINRRLDDAVYNFEIGHQYMPSAVEAPQTFEQLVSGRALEKKVGKKPYEVTDEQVWESLAEKLAYGVHNLIVHWSPEVVVMGGSMLTRPIGIKLDRVRHYLRLISKIYPELPQLRLAELGDFGGLHGGLEMVASQAYV